MPHRSLTAVLALGLALLLAAPAQASVRATSTGFTWAAVGDSLTLGWGASSSERSYPADAGIPGDGKFGQCLVATSCFYATSLVDHFPAELGELAADDVNAVIVEIGTNDLGHGVTDAQYRAAYRQVVAEGRQGGAWVVLSTIPPFGPNHAAAAGDEAQRERINTWIRSRRQYVDYAAALGGDQLQPAYDSGDGLHLSDAGYAVMAAAATAWMSRFPSYAGPR